MPSTRLNGRHISSLVAAVCVAIVLTPITVLATTSSTGTKVNITDPSNATHKAHVSATGALSIGGAVSVTNGSITANPGLPGTPFSAESSGSTPTVVFPAAKHLVVQNISITTALTSGASVFADVEYTTAGVSGDLYIPLTYVETNSGNDYYSTSTVVNVYASPGTSIILNMSSPTGTFSFKTLDVSGYVI